ncbi:MAG TPA: choice-of-anchor tandem repeat GloVer-containing protein, partial [Candidatus Angelobacter sp.]|nr:choice-of-anchor tandem repeat GloVer-containing protein [Candidatus Angelobacter sp.]
MVFPASKEGVKRVYGTTVSGGFSTSYGGNGTVFRISTNGMLITLYSFLVSTDGAAPNALVQGSDGSFYGTTYNGGTNSQGTVFEISTNGVLSYLYFFADTNDGVNPNGLVQGSDGNFYGTTSGGGTNNQGTVFKISANGVLTSLYSFTGGNDGGNPYAGLVQGSDGSFYGTT